MSRPKRRRAGQGELAFRTHGGKRPGAGRPKGPRPRVYHRRREKLDRHCPVHTTLRLCVRHTRTKKLWKVVCDVVSALHAARPDVRVTDFSLQDGHLHAIVEGDTAEALRFGLHSLPIRLGKAINRALGRKGRVFDDRHHRHVLRTPAEVRYAKAYVLLNRRRHLAKEGRPMEDGLDPLSSAPWFEGWIRPQLVEPPPETVRVTRDSKTWLGTIGWKRRGLLSPSEIPGVSKAKRAKGASKAPAATSADRRNTKQRLILRG